AAKTELVPGVDEFFLYKLEAGTVTNMAPNLLWGEARKQFKRIEETGTQKFVEKDGVNMDSDIGELLERTHVLVERAKQRVYSEMLSLTDMVSGSNSFYTFCVLESDKDSGGSCYWVWRKWGRIGVSQGGTKLEEFKSSKQAAIAQFSKLYLEKTGNTYGHKPSEFTQKPGKFSRVDIQHKALQNKKAKTEQEEEVGVEDGDAQGGQPLGQLSKAAVEKGNGVLDQIENLLNDIGEGGTPSPVQKGKIAAHSAEFYSLIPHNFGMKAPPPINTQDLLGAERALLQFYLRMGFEEIGGEDEEKLTPISGVMELPLPKTLLEGCKGICAPKEVNSCTKKGQALAVPELSWFFGVVSGELS
ncbi:Poly [ADP-ribose] polymerase 1 (PARP-1) (ADP-ribosyltransferase diphtheria toxin-like 1) (ARTD1) (DNA ADP-ribosyltransferase PARP1) (NAD(+) ADP-ribosyltransferase 1) (ADPRT 1) (Poly[ADP-ribose] synthase 1) (Protein poly-ADP-ribosyltransferase PARP1) (Fragment), partial [Durusdinium trenchii]